MSSPTSFFPSLHLDSPILDINLKRVETLEKARKKAHVTTFSAALDHINYKAGRTDKWKTKQIAETLDKGLNEFGLGPKNLVQLTPYDYPKWFRRQEAAGEGVLEANEKAVKFIQPIVSAHVQALAELTGTTASGLETVEYSPWALSHMISEDLYARVIESYNTNRISGLRGALTYRRSEVTWVVTDDIVLAHFHKEKDVVTYMTYEQLLMLRDCCMMRKNALVAAWVIYPNDVSMQTLAERSFEWQEQCLSDYGNQGFELGKSVESLAKAYLARTCGDPLSGPGDAFDLMLEKVRAKEDSIRHETNMPMLRWDHLADVYHILVLEEVTSPHHVAELFGLQKFFGHPTIDPYKSLAKVKQIAQKDNKAWPAFRFEQKQLFCALFVESFIRKHRRWPKVVFWKRGTRLEELYSTQTLAIRKNSYSLRDWNYADLSKEFDFNYYDDYLDLMDDKSISLYKSDKHFTWDAGSPKSYQRLLLELMSRNSFSVADIVKLIEEGKIPDEWKICSLYPKEREFKLAARMFTMMPIEMRTFFTTHEANLSETILQYFPQITMKDSKMTVHQRLLDLTKPLDNPDIGVIQNEQDLAAWNIEWRAEVVDPVGNQINRLFGLKNVYTTVHAYFKEALMMVRVSGCRPEGVELADPPEGDLMYRNHLGGLEGIAQKLWSICTVLRVEKAMRDRPYSYSITEQGDNVVLTFTYARDGSRSEYDQGSEIAAEVLEACRVSFAEVNQVMKPEESFVTSRTLTYSKAVLVMGADYPTSMKAMSRVHPSSAVDFPSHSSYVQAIFSGALTAAEVCKRPEMCYRLALLQAASYLVRTGEYGGAYLDSFRAHPELRERRGVILQLITPSELGGLPIIGPYSFLYKGGGDPLSKSIASLKMLQAHLPEARQVIGIALKDELYNPNPRFRSLLMDPYGLPVWKPTAPSDAIADGAIAVMKSFVKNEEIREVVMLDGSEFEKKLLEALSKLVPFNPVVARDIWDASALGTLDTMKRMFVKTRTLTKLSRDREDLDLVETMLKAGQVEVYHTSLMVASTRGLSENIGSVHDFVAELRHRWDPAGVIVRGMTSYLPIDFPVEWEPREASAGIDCELRTGGRDIFYERGPERPFIGSMTQQHATEHGYKIAGTGRSVTAVRTLQKILSWSEFSPEFVKLLDTVCQSRADIKLSDAANFLSGVLGGDIGHRYASRIGERGATILGTTAAASFCTLDSDSAGFLSASNEDFLFMFQEAFLYLIALISNRWDRLSRNPGTSSTAEYMLARLRVGEIPMEQLAADNIGLSEVVEVPPFVNKLRLVYADTLILERIGGPQWSRPDLYSSRSTLDLRFSALVQVFFDAICDPTTSLGVLQGASAKLNTAIGLAEIVGAGLSEILDAAACALLDGSYRTIYARRTRRGLERRDELYLIGLAQTISESISRYIGHPLLENDPVVTSLNLGPSPAYMSSTSVASQIAAEIVSRTERLRSDVESVWYRTPNTVFGDTRGAATIEAQLRFARKLSTRLALATQVDQEQITAVVSARVRKLFDLESREEVEMFANLEGIAGFSPPMTVNRVPVCRQAYMVVEFAIRESFKGNLPATSQAASEVIRLYRYTPSDRKVREQERMCRRIDARQVNIAVMAAIVAAPPTTLPVEMETLDQRLQRSISRYLGHKYDLGAISLSTWRAVASFWPSSTLIVVGSGLGGAAAAFALAGYSSVYGHDLGADLPDGIARKRYVPPLVRLAGKSASYNQTVESFLNGGDFWDPETSRALLSSYPGEIVVVVDISSERGWSHEALDPLVLNGFRGLCYLRICGRRRTHAEVAARLALLTSSFIAYQIRVDGTWSEVIYRFRLSSWKELRTVRPMIVTNPVLVVPRPYAITIKQVASLHLSHLGGWVGETLREACVNSLFHLEGLVAGGTIRPAYKHWSLILSSAMFSDILLRADNEDLVRIVTDCLSSASYTLKRFPSMTVKVPKRLNFMLTHSVPGLSLSLDDRRVDDVV